MEVLRYLYKLKRWIVSFCYTNEETFSFALNSIGDSNAEFNWMVVVPKDVIIQETITRKQLDTVEHKHLLWYPRDFYCTVPSDKKIKLFQTEISSPWLWIGGITKSGEEIDMTEQLKEYLLFGNVIKPIFLSKLNPNIIKWTYLDQTFNQVDFPTQGIVIKNDSIKQETSETSTEKED